MKFETTQFGGYRASVVLEDRLIVIEDENERAALAVFSAKLEEYLRRADEEILYWRRMKRGAEKSLEAARAALEKLSETES